MQRGQRSLTADTLVAIGILISLGLIAISATLNFRMAYRTADTELDGWIYGMGAGLADGLKALLPFMMWWAWRHRHFLAVGIAIVLFTVLTAYSLTASLGFAAQHRAFREAERVGAVERRANLREELTRTTERLATLDPQRSEGEVAQEVEAVFAKPAIKSNRTVGEVSKRCTLNRWQTRKACAQVAELMKELAKAKDWAELDARARATRAELDRLGDSGAGGADDPQIKTLQNLTRIVYREAPAGDVRLGLVLLTGLMVELGSGFGLYLVTVPWRDRAGGQRMMEGAVKLGAVEDYALERIVPQQDAELTETDIFTDYVRWCVERNEAPLRGQLFIEQFDSLAREAEIGRRHKSGQAIFADVAFADTGTTPQ